MWWFKYQRLAFDCEPSARYARAKYWDCLHRNWLKRPTVFESLKSKADFSNDSNRRYAAFGCIDWRNYSPIRSVWARRDRCCLFGIYPFCKCNETRACLREAFTFGDSTADSWRQIRAVLGLHLWTWRWVHFEWLVKALRWGNDLSGGCRKYGFWAICAHGLDEGRIR